MKIKYELHVEKFEVTAWRDGCVYESRSLGCGWFTDAEIDANRDKNIMYVAASDEYARNNSTIRKARRDGRETSG